MKPFLLIFFSLSFLSITAQQNFDIEGHRGWRGLYPENTIVAFIEAVKLGANTIEMDIQISKDEQIVVSHDPTINCNICNYCEEAKQKEMRIYRLNYKEIKQIDCGSKYNSDFAEQKKMFAAKPLLKDVIDSVEKFILQNHLPSVQYNIEIKSSASGDDKKHPKPKWIVKMLYDLLKEKYVLDKCIVQSFDVRPLQLLHQTDPNVPIALLAAGFNSFEKNIKRLGFNPSTYSPYFAVVSKKLTAKCHTQNIKIVPWTVNSETQMKKLKSMKVDGLITDYPDRAIKLLRN